MIPLLLGAQLAHAGVIGVVIGASEYWTDRCAQGEARPECLDHEQVLRYADDDAWRAAYFLTTVTEARRIRVLTEVDDSTRGRAFPGAAIRPPTRENLVDAVRELRAEAGESPVTAVLFIAAHGSPQEVHLADGRHDFQALRMLIQRALDEDDELVLVADACSSARWRSSDYSVRPMPYFPPVEASHGRVIEAVVDGITPEDEDVLGGVFTYLTLSAWMGAGDTNEDGEVSVQELLDQLFRYAAAGSKAPFAPVVRAPRGSSTHPLPARPYGGTIAVGAPGPARWLVFARVEGATALGVPVGEVFTEGRQHGQITVPPGEYSIVQLPCLWDAARRAYSAIGTEATLHHLVVNAAETSTITGPGETVHHGQGSTRGELAEVMEAIPVIALEALPTSRARYHGGDRWWIGASADVGTPVLSSAGRDAPVLGASLSVRHPLGNGRVQLMGRGGWLAEVGGTEASELNMATFDLTAQVVALSAPHAFFGPVGGAYLDFGVATSTRGPQTFKATYFAPGALLGARATWVPGRTAWHVDASWAPTQVWVDERQGLNLKPWRTELEQFRFALGGELSW